MGLACSPSAFNKMIQRFFSDQSAFCRDYIDDLFIFTKRKSIDDHLKALDKVLRRFKLAKSAFWASDIPCLGDNFGRDGIRIDPDKVSVIREWPLPRPKRQLQSFVGTCVYVLKYCENFAALAAPLM
ncbi:Uncharacterized protein PHPALM_14325 [Phytophthora palmivora]|uniref:Reverse transcriptase domain-containing protein n=1 Tax=Phytophthora palmivora TaxID=4796 RepID=A0A2P4XV33_9STRA|nr:Uncharacterized protein PHPALM_14325 [Phytophthora palmivora]